MTMSAVVQDEYGEAGDVLRLDTIARPEPGAGEVLLRVHAAGVDKGAWHLMAGLPYLVRLVGYGVRAPKTPVRGREAAGTVVALGPDVTAFAVGDEVFGFVEGAFAEYVVGRADMLVAKPESLAFDEAAALPISGVTAIQAVRDKGEVRSGDAVLVIGASGGVGSYVVQLAKAFGAEVTAVTSAAKADLVRSLGADHLIAYDDADIDERGVHYDVVIDIGGSRSLSELRSVLAPEGRLVIVGGETDGRWLGGLDRLVRAKVLSPFVGGRLRTFTASENADDVQVLADLVESGDLRPTIDRSFPLPEVPDAIEHLQAGRARGKLVIHVA